MTTERGLNAAQRRASVASIERNLALALEHWGEERVRRLAECFGRDTR
jgi:hypothetical protein